MPGRTGLSPASVPEKSGTILQFKVWLMGLSPMVWRRVHVPAAFTLRQLHGVIQVAMGWEGIHLFQFHLRAIRYGSWEVSARSSEVTLESLRLRRGARFAYEYDLNIPWGTKSGSKSVWSPSPNEPIRFARMATRPVRPRIAVGRPAILPGAKLGAPWTHSMISASSRKSSIRL